MYTYVYTYIYMYACMYVCTYMNIIIYLCIYIYKHTRAQQERTRMGRLKSNAEMPYSCATVTTGAATNPKDIVKAAAVHQ